MGLLMFKCNKKVPEKYDALIDKQRYKSANWKSVRPFLLGVKKGQAEDDVTVSMRSGTL